MRVGIAEIAKALLELWLVTGQYQNLSLEMVLAHHLRIGVSVQTQQIDFDTWIATICVTIVELAMSIESEAGSVGILVGVKQNICAIVLVVAGDESEGPTISSILAHTL